MPDGAEQGRASSKRGGIPLSPPQQAALLPERLHGLPVPNLFIAVEIRGALDVALLRQALVGMLTDHEILRTVFPSDRRIPHQQVSSVPSRILEVVQLDPAHLGARLDADAEQRFELAHEIPIRVQLYQMPHCHVLSITVHPVAADDRALELLVQELSGRYSGKPLSGGAVQYRDFVGGQLRSLTATPATSADLAYWTQQLADLPQLPRAWSGADAPATMARREVLIDTATMTALFDAQPDVDTSVVLAAVVSAMVTGRPGDDVPIGVVDIARTLPGTDTAIGNFANHLVLRLHPPVGRTVEEVIGDAARTVWDARSHAGTRIEQLTHWLRGSSGYTGQSLFPVLIRVRPDAGDALTPEWTELSRRIARPPGVDLVVDAAVTDEVTVIRVEFPAVLSGLPEIETFVERFASQCREWAADPHVLVATTAAAVFTAADAAPDDGLRGLGGAPCTETEQLLADLIWQLADLDGEAIGREDNFFSLGGDSISALRLVTVLAQSGYTVEVRTVFGHPVLHELAAEIDRATGTSEVKSDAVSTEFAPMSASGLDDAALRAVSGRFTTQHATE